MRLETDLVEICEAMLLRNLSELEIKWRQGSSACIVLASEGYPAKPRTGDVINGLEEASAIEGVEIFHAGTKSEPPALVGGQLDGKDSRSWPPADAGGSDFITSGGRVFGVTATGNDLTSALSLAYSAVEKINWPGMQYRRDIGK